MIQRKLGFDDAYFISEATAKPFDADVGDVALTGTYEVDGVEVKPGFQRLKDHVRRYTPDVVEDITTVPAATTVRLAREYGEASQIGSTIDIAA